MRYFYKKLTERLITKQSATWRHRNVQHGIDEILDVESGRFRGVRYFINQVPFKVATPLEAEWMQQQTTKRTPEYMQSMWPKGSCSCTHTFKSKPIQHQSTLLGPCIGSALSATT